VPIGTADIDRVTDPRNPLSKELLKADQFSFSYIGFDTTVPPFDDPKVRQALALAIDKEKLASVVLKNMAAKAEGILPPGIPGYNKDLKTLSFDAARAKQLLAESKYAGKLPPMMLTVSGTGAAPVGTPPAIQEMIKQNLGIDIDIQLVETGTFFSGLYARRYPMFITGWIADYPDPYDFLDILFHSKSELNHGNYTNTQLDQLLEAARLERDEARRMQLYQQAEQILISDAAVIPLEYAREYWLVKPYVKGVKRSPLIIPWLQNVSVEGPTN
jgi:oligopeptide transport system substrate-binding protein